MNIRFTVSGGLETFAYKEVSRIFLASKLVNDANVALSWEHHGNSGSVLQWHGDDDDSPQFQASLETFCCRAVKELCFVDYVYLEFLPADQFGIVDADNLQKSKRLVDEITIRLSMTKSVKNRKDDRTERIALCTNIARMCQSILGKTTQVGLEKLSGLLLPTPEVSALVEEHDESKKQQQRQDESMMNINTIYTRNCVAKAIVEVYVKLVKDYTQKIMNSVTIDSQYSATFQWLDVGAGAGAFYKHIPEGNKIGIDTHPRHPDLKRMDFFRVQRAWLEDQQNQKSNNNHYLCIISNPPFVEGSRGDFSAIVKFINHSIKLGANFLGLVVPVRFARERIWLSLGLDVDKIQLIARFLLPNSSFYDPNLNHKPVHIHCYFLFFRIGIEIENCVKVIENDDDDELDTMLPSSSSFYITGKRDKGRYPWISTADFTKSVVRGLEQSGLMLTSQADAEFTISTKLSSMNDKANDDCVLETFLLLNPARPLSLVNSSSQRVPNHSLGWMSLSAKPAISRALCQLSMIRDQGNINNNDVIKSDGIIINAMSGEGTIELEADGCLSSYFMISGDINATRLHQTASRLENLKHRPLVDLVVWDAQRLPLRNGIAAEAFIADLPISGSSKKRHQQPSINSDDDSTKSSLPSSSSSSHPLPVSISYQRIMAEAMMKIHPNAGKGVFLSVDRKALGRVIGMFNWEMILKIDNINIGGLQGSLMSVKRKEPCYKDISLWISSSASLSSTIMTNLENELLLTGRKAVATMTRDPYLELIDDNSLCTESSRLIVSVKRIDSFYHVQKQMTSHCYRITFEGNITNKQAKLLERKIRSRLELHPPSGVYALR